MRKAARYNLDPKEFRNMHFAYAFDENYAFNEDFNKLKDLIVNKK
jgi:hypothetical protein